MKKLSDTVELVLFCSFLVCGFLFLFLFFNSHMPSVEFWEFIIIIVAFLCVWFFFLCVCVCVCFTSYMPGVEFWYNMHLVR